MIDHSQTYKNFKIRNLPHILRLKSLIAAINRIKQSKTKINRYADIGCSNGYLTKQVNDILKPDDAYGFDHSKINLDRAREDYSEINFVYIDLNRFSDFEVKYDVITCFETLEHVGNLNNAIDQILEMASDEGTILISVPIEVGFWGFLKFIIKTSLYNYDLNELNVSKSQYLKCLLTNGDIDRFRPKNMKGFGTHFGFDYRIVESILASKGCVFETASFFTTRIIFISR